MNILFVCTGNTCRSPMAEGYLDSKKIPNLKVESRGISAQGGSLSQNALTVMLEKGIDLSDDVSAGLTAGDLLWADKIICMSTAHRTVLSLYAPAEKIYILAGGISDPYGGDESVYRKCRDEIFSAIDCLIADGFFEETVIEKGTVSDIKAIARLEKACFSIPWSENTLISAMENSTIFFVAKRGKKTVGYIGISCVADEGYITNIAVNENYRKKGIGTKLLNRVFALARDNQLSFVSLEVRTSNLNAISLYTNLGFKEEGRRKNFYESPKEDALIFTKRF